MLMDAVEDTHNQQNPRQKEQVADEEPAQTTGKPHFHRPAPKAAATFCFQQTASYEKETGAQANVFSLIEDFLLGHHASEASQTAGNAADSATEALQGPSRT